MRSKGVARPGSLTGLFAEYIKDLAMWAVLYGAGFLVVVALGFWGAFKLVDWLVRSAND